MDFERKVIFVVALPTRFFLFSNNQILRFRAASCRCRMQMGRDLSGLIGEVRTQKTGSREKRLLTTTVVSVAMLNATSEGGGGGAGYRRQEQREKPRAAHHLRKLESNRARKIVLFSFVCRCQVLCSH